MTEGLKSGIFIFHLHSCCFPWVNNFKSLFVSELFSDRVLKCLQGVTYCGESSASSLTMANVPWHQEVVAFVQQLADMLPQYEIACEHEHSNCLLIAHTKVRTPLQSVRPNLTHHVWSLYRGFSKSENMGLLSDKGWKKASLVYLLSFASFLDAYGVLII